MKAVNPWKVLTGLLGCLAVALGGLWLLQGLGLVHIRPILCFADCAEIQDASTLWAIIGLVVTAAGIWALANSLSRPRAR